MKKGITFIIPSINRPTIKESINSLIQQTNSNWECVVVYDGVDGPLFEDERIRTIKIDKTGGNDNIHGMSGLVRNAGIKMVDTEWVGFLDDDDTLDHEYVETLLRKYSEYDAVLFRMRYANGLIIPQISDSRLYFGNVGISFCYKIKESPLLFDSNRNGEDFDMVDKLQKSVDKFTVADEILYNVNH